ncbi:MAG: hypothetical protein ACR2NZ_18515 [Rubripirellula sp.]
MRSVSCVFSCVLFAAVSTAATVSSIKDKSTHEQTGLIEIDDGAKSLKINAFCLNSKGQIIAVCGTGPGEVRVVDDEGKIVNSWDVDVKPESVGVADDDSILVGGEGKLFRYGADGNLITEVDSPHADRLRDSKEALRKEALAYLKRRQNSRDPLSSLKMRVTSYEAMMTQLKERSEKSGLNESEERLVKMLPSMLERYQQQIETMEAEAEKQSDEEKLAAEEARKKGPSESEIKTQVASLVRSKMRVSSISSNSDHVFVTTRGIEGYGYDVWKMSLDFSDAEVVVTGLSGCCGQMDVQCCESGLFVAENSRDRVVHYDVDGNEITQWGKSDRTGVNGFSSCCNPMNVCFDNDGYIYTAESGSGRIKRFDSSGKLISYIGDVDLVPGCKNVSIAVSPVSDKIYMLDLTRNHIKVMEPKSKDSETVDSDVSEDDKSASKFPRNLGNAAIKIRFGKEAVQ